MWVFEKSYLGWEEQFRQIDGSPDTAEVSTLTVLGIEETFKAKERGDSKDFLTWGSAGGLLKYTCD